MRIGFVSLPLSGHLNPMTALARKLQARGHDVVFFGFPDAGRIIRSADLQFVSIGKEEYPLGSILKELAPVAKMHGLAVLEYTFHELLPGYFQAAAKHLPGKLMELGIEAMVIDTAHTFLQLVPMSLGLPYAQIWNALHNDASGTTPPRIFSWPYETTAEGRAKNLKALQEIGPIYDAVKAAAKVYAEKTGLPIDWNNPNAAFTQTVITQAPKEFDFPGIPWPEHFHYAGPFHDDYGREPVSFPWEKLNGKQLIYASLGTLVNGLPEVTRAILAAVGAIRDVQMVFSVGKNVNAEELGPIPANTILVNKAPQIELLKRASLCITHAGLNTALESLGQGVPMIAIPIGYDQPGVAARIAYHGVGEFIEVEDLTAERLAELIQRVLPNPSYLEKARYFQKVIARTHGLDVAADAIEQAFGVQQTAGAHEALQHA